MKTSKKELPIKGLILVAILLMVPMLATAMGNSEKPYGTVLSEEFSSIADAVESGEMDVRTAVEQLHELRAEYNRTDNEDYQEMERLLTRIQAKEMTAFQAREQIRLLDECQAGVPENKLQQQEQNMNQIRTQTASQNQVQSGDAASDSSSSGQSSPGSSDTAKEKNN